jgi:hypothetical protein
MTQAPVPYWDDERFEQDRQLAIAQFRIIRMQEPLEQYLAAFDERRSSVENLIESTVDLSQLSQQAVELLTDAGTLEAIRYLASPPLSADDLKILADASLAPTRLRNDPDMAQRVVDTVLLGLDRIRFPWVSEDREPTDAERQAAIVATSALMAARRVMTDRANESKEEQESSTVVALLAAGFTQVPTRTVSNLSQSPAKGELCRESLFGPKKADILLGLWDGRVMAIECKVSNSSTNSIKRLNGDAAQKAVVWVRQFGQANVVPAAVLSGVFKLGNLRSAQADGLAIFWAHDLASLLQFIESTKPQGSPGTGG